MPTLFDLSTLNLAEGEYSITVRAKGTRLKDSEESQLTYRERKSFSVTVASDATYIQYPCDAVKSDGSQVDVGLGTTVDGAVSVILYTGSGGGTWWLYRMPPTAEQTLIEVDQDTTLVLIDDILIEDTNLSYCLLGDTMITMADDSTKEFKDIVVGDEIKFYDFEQKQWRSAVVTWFHMVHPEGTIEDRTRSKQLFYNEYIFSDGTVIKIAMRHRFYNVEQQAFVYMPLWNIGEHTLKADGTEVALVRARRVEVDTPITYCQMKFENENYVNFIANGCITGDRRCPTPATFDQYVQNNSIKSEVIL